MSSEDRIKEIEQRLKRISDDITYFDTLQYTLKITLNSIYGTFANKHSPFMDIDNASSITLTGQAVAKAGSDIIREHTRNTYGVEDDVVIYNDTDSVYITIDPLLKKQNIQLVTNNNHVTEEAHKIVNDIDSVVNVKINEWAKKELNSNDPRYEFKREAIASVGTFLQKKRYIIHVLDNEGIPTNKFKYVGVEVARSTTPKQVKVFIKKIIETAFKTKDVKSSNIVFREAYDLFKTLDVQDISFRKAVKDYEKYSHGSTLNNFNKGTPCHVKAAIAYNLLLEHYNLTGKYEKISSGQKIKYFYATKNKHNLDAVAFVADYPKEFQDIIRIDYDKMFEKTVVAPIESVYNAINWRVPNFSREVQTDLFDLFGE